jgi:hypothetical protein
MGRLLAVVLSAAAGGAVGFLSDRHLASVFGVSHTQVACIHKHKVWAAQ